MSVRLRLTLWNVCVLALMLIGLGAALRVTLQVSLLASLDHTLAGALVQEQRMAEFPPPPDMSPRPMPGIKPPQSPPNQGRDDGPFGPFGPQSWNVHGKALEPHRPPPHAESRSSGPYDMSLFLISRFGLQEQAWSLHQIGSEQVRFLSVPLRRDGRIVGVAQAGCPLTEIQEEIRRLTSVLLLLAGPALVLAGLGGASFTNRALRPVRQITHAAGRIEAEDLSGRLPVVGRDELSELAVTFNGMLGRLEEAFVERARAYAKLEQAYARLEDLNGRLERAYEQQRRFTADASHELKTPLTVIEGTVSLSLSGRRTAEQHRQALERVGRSAGVMTRIVQDLLLLARSDSGELVHAIQCSSIADVLALARESASSQDHLPNIHIGPASAVVSGDPNHLVRLFVNLLDNASRHIPPDGRITVTTVTDATTITVTIQDTGVGIETKHLPHLFERFYRVDAARSRNHGGTGLGLAICRSIVEAHQGSIHIESELGKGTTVTVCLPRTAAQRDDNPGNDGPALPENEADQGRCDDCATQKYGG